jgi:hypothetical protein
MFVTHSHSGKIIDRLLLELSAHTSIIMVRTASSTTKSIQSSVAARQRVRRKVTAIISALAAGGSAAQYVTPHIVKTPMYNSCRTGLKWVQELLEGHDQWFYNMMGLNKHVYRCLL